MTSETPCFDLRGLIENSLLEWENMVAAVVIAGGCTLRCPYCHSWRYVTGLDSLEPIPHDRLFSLLERQRGWIDGVVFTGGEPTAQPGLGDMIEKTREYGVKIKLHSNGTRPDVLRELLEANLLDCLSLDYKAPLDERFFSAAGIPENEGLLEHIRESFRMAASADVDREYHTTLAPQFVDVKTLGEMAHALEPGGVWFLQQLETNDCLDPAMAQTARYSSEQLDQFLAVAKTGHENVVLKKGSSA